MMGKLDRILISVVIFTLALAAGVIGQAGQTTVGDEIVIVDKTEKMADIKLVEARFNNVAKTSAPAEKNLYPTTLWLLGSALLAMVGYKRMRNTFVE